MHISVVVAYNKPLKGGENGCYDEQTEYDLFSFSVKVGASVCKKLPNLPCHD